jgi:hypothetical protein
VTSAVSGRAGTTTAAVATSSPDRLAPAASPNSTPNRRYRCGVCLSGWASELTRAVSVPVRYVVVTSARPMSLAAAACTPMAAVTVASRQNCAQPAGRASLTSQPTVNPASSTSSARSAQVTCAGHTPAFSPCLDRTP